MTTPRRRLSGALKLSLIVSLIATAAIYLAMVLWSLPLIQAEAGGLPPFDLRTMGYSEGEARAFLAALSDIGRRQYLGSQHLLDTAYPALLALTLTLGFLALFSSGWKWRWIIVALVAAGADYAENSAVAALLLAPADTVTSEQIAWAALWTLVKSVATALVFSALILRLLWAIVQRVFRKRR